MAISHLPAFFEDGRMPIEELYRAYEKLEQYGFKKELIGWQNGGGDHSDLKLPIFGYIKAEMGKDALWMISGVHGEEPPGPEAIAQEVDQIGELSRNIPFVIIPLCNPVGRYLGWRYQDEYRDHHKGTSVSDSEHWLLQEGGSKPRTDGPSNKTAEFLTKFVVEKILKYPPLLSVDLHEDEALPESYIYSQGDKGVDDKVARRIVEIMQESSMAIQTEGETRFGEKIVSGVVLATVDGSLDELMAAKRIFYGDKVIDKPYAKTAIVVETPTIGVPLIRRVNAHRNIIKALGELWQIVKKDQSPVLSIS